MNKFFYYFMTALLLIVLGYYFYDGQPTGEGYGWLFAAWLAILAGAVVYDRWKAKSLNDKRRR